MILAAATAIVVAAGVYGVGVFGALTNEEGFVNPSAESYVVQKTIKQDFGKAPTAVVMFSSKDGKLKVEDE